MTPQGKRHAEALPNRLAYGRIITQPTGSEPLGEKSDVALKNIPVMCGLRHQGLTILRGVVVLEISHHIRVGGWDDLVQRRERAFRQDMMRNCSSVTKGAIMKGIMYRFMAPLIIVGPVSLHKAPPMLMIDL